MLFNYVLVFLIISVFFYIFISIAPSLVIEYLSLNLTANITNLMQKLERGKPINNSIFKKLLSMNSLLVLWLLPQV